MSRNWTVRDAKRHFKDLLKAACCNPQVVTRHGKRVAVVIASGEYVRLRELQRVNAPSFVEFLLAMPQAGDDFEPERIEAPMRDPGF